MTATDFGCRSVLVKSETQPTNKPVFKMLLLPVIYHIHFPFEKKKLKIKHLNT